MSEQELQVILARSHAKIADITHSDCHDADEGPESELQARIKDHCKNRGWPCLSFPQTRDVKKFLPPGYPDITIIMPFGTVMFIELKAKRGRLSPEQRLMKSMFHHLGHEIHEVRSFKRFLEIVEALLRNE